MTISEEDLRGLSAVERESLLSTDEGDEDLVRELGLAAPAGAAAPAPALAVDAGEGEGGDDDVTDVQDKLSAAPAPALAAAPAVAPAAAPASAVDEAEEDAPAMAPQRSTPADVADQRKTLRTERADAMEKLLAGEIDRAAFSEIEDRVNDRLDALVRAEASDDAREQVTRDSMMTDYNSEVRNSQKDLRAAGLDVKDKAIGAEFDRAVRMFAAEAGERGLTDAPGNLAASKAALADATEYLLRRHGKAATTPAPAPALSAAPKPPARTPKPVDRSTFPPTLAAVPAAADVTISSEFAHLESLEGADLERALAKMSPEQQERYLT